MKIIALQAENIKKIVAVEIRPNGNVVQITGKNGQGKTSVLDSIWWALAGAGTVQSAPIRNGQDTARIRLDLGEIVVTRTFRTTGPNSEATTTLSVVNADGSKFPSPQAMLDSLVGALSFDPLAFARMDPHQQFKVLAGFVPGLDFAAIEQANKADYDKRTEANRRAREARVLADKITVPLDGPTEAVNNADLIDQLEKSAQVNADVQARKNNRAIMADKAMKARAEAKRLISEAMAIEKRLAEAPPLPVLVDVTALRQRIAEAQEINADVSNRKAKRQYLDEAAAYEHKANGYTNLMEMREKEKREKIATTKLPVQGLEFGDGSILLNGAPFEQASDAEKLRASIAIAMASNPKLRVIRVRDGSLLDDDSMGLLSEMAGAADFQVWIERVGDSGMVGFTLEDGHIKAKEIANK